MKPRDLESRLHIALKEIERLRRENEDLKQSFDPGSSGTSPPDSARTPPAAKVESTFDQNSPASAKIALFQRLFHGRTDVYPVRWENRKGKNGYAPACDNEWKPGVCRKPQVKCGECTHQAFRPLDEKTVFQHLSGQIVAGVYPLSRDETCWFLAVDLDGGAWRDDAIAFMESCRVLEVPAALEISRSGEGAHVWIFFTEAVPAELARRLGSALITYTCAQKRQLALSSYDRLFPNQDTLPKGGFGNLIALPLQKAPRERGASVFVDGALTPYPDQWSFLASVKRVEPKQIEAVTQLAAAGGSVLDVAFLSAEDEVEPWRRTRATRQERVVPPLPERLSVVLADQIYLEKANLSQPLANRLIRLAAFQNPEFYRAQAMRLPVWDKPRIIGCAENYSHHIALPRGCLDALLKLLGANEIGVELHDERVRGCSLKTKFCGTLLLEQRRAADAVKLHDIGVLCAPTGFGKTVTAAAIIAERAVNTLVLVHRAELLDQWHEQLRTLLEVGPDDLGVIGSGKHRHTGKVDVAMMQALIRRGEVKDLVQDYGQVIADECHHLSAFSFERILKHAKAKFVLGLTATPVRRDGHHPIITMQCGPIRYQAIKDRSAFERLVVRPRLTVIAPGPSAERIQQVFGRLAADAARNSLIVSDVVASYRGGRHVLVLTERTEHVEILKAELVGAIPNLFVLHGRMPRGQRARELERLRGLAQHVPRVVVATGRLIGEGFDHPSLDTLVLAMPISWKGTLQQYAGRLHRRHASKTNICIFDYVDDGVPALARMWGRRQRGYLAMGYEIGAPTYGEGIVSEGFSLST